VSYYKRLRELREDHDMSQRTLAKILGLTQPQYCRYEQGYRDLPTDILVQLADIYHTSTDYILGRTNNPKDCICTRHIRIIRPLARNGGYPVKDTMSKNIGRMRNDVCAVAFWRKFYLPTTVTRWRELTWIIAKKSF